MKSKILDALIISIVFLTIIIYRFPIFSDKLYCRMSRADTEVVSGDIARFAIVVRNTHFWPVWIEKINGSCGCVMPSLKDFPLKLDPFGSELIQVGVDTTGKKGVMYQKIKIVTSDSKNGTVVDLMCVVK